jgi:hypothetical protein
MRSRKHLLNTTQYYRACWSLSLGSFSGPMALKWSNLKLSSAFFSTTEPTHSALLSTTCASVSPSSSQHLALKSLTSKKTLSLVSGGAMHKWPLVLVCAQHALRTFAQETRAGLRQTNICTFGISAAFACKTTKLGLRFRGIHTRIISLRCLNARTRFRRTTLRNTA